MSATQDEIAWAMTFNILATAVVTPMTGWLVSRFGTKRVMVCSIGLLHARDTAVRDGAVARDAGVVAHPAGRRGRAGGAAVAVDPVRHVSAPPAHHGDVGLRDGGRGRAGVRSGSRRLSRRDLQLALVVLHAGADRHLRHHRHEPDPAADRAADEGPLRLDRLPRARHRACRHPAGARARRAARLVQFDGDRDRVPDRGARILRLHRAQPRRPRAVPEPEAADRPQLRDRPRAGDDLRHAELHADGAAAAAAAAACRILRRAGRAGDRMPRPRHADRASWPRAS